MGKIVRAYIAKHEKKETLFLVVQAGAGYEMYPISHWEIPPSLDKCKAVTDEFDIKDSKFNK